MIFQEQIPFPSNFPSTNNIIIDCDTGGDDAQTILLCFHLAKKYNKKIVGIFCCEGNCSIQNVVKNVLICKGVLILKNQQLRNHFPPIIKGASINLLGDPIYEGGDDFFHKDGLCSNQQKYIKIVQKIFDFHSQYKQIMNRTQTCPQLYNNISKKYANDLSIMAIGPLTNLALAYHYDNHFAQRINSLSIMGCQYSGMGMWQYFTADFNFNLDPHAAHIVMKVFNNIVILSLQYAFAYQTERIKDIFVNKQTLKSQLVADIYGPIMKMFPMPCLCDPQTAFPLFCPSQMKAKCMMLSGVVQTMGKRTRGFFALRNPFDNSEKKQYSLRILIKHSYKRKYINHIIERIFNHLLNFIKQKTII